MFKKILVPTDGSAYSKRAFLVALEVGRKFNAEITLLNCIVTPEALGYVLTNNETVVQQQNNVNGDTALAATFKDVNLEGIKLFQKQKPGYPASVILDEIKSEDIDLIIMGYRG